MFYLNDCNQQLWGVTACRANELAECGSGPRHTVPSVRSLSKTVGPKVRGAPPRGAQSHCWGAGGNKTHTNNYVFIHHSDLLISYYSSLPLCVFFSFIRWMSKETTGSRRHAAKAQTWTQPAALSHTACGGAERHPTVCLLSSTHHPSAQHVAVPPRAWICRTFLPIKREFFFPTVAERLLLGCRLCIIIDSLPYIHIYTVKHLEVSFEKI